MDTSSFTPSTTSSLRANRLVSIPGGSAPTMTKYSVPTCGLALDGADSSTHQLRDSSRGGPALLPFAGAGPSGLAPRTVSTKAEQGYSPSQPLLGRASHLRCRARCDVRAIDRPVKGLRYRVTRLTTTCVPRWVEPVCLSSGSSSVRLLPPFARWQIDVATLLGVRGRTEEECSSAVDRIGRQRSVAIIGRQKGLNPVAGTPRMSAVLLDEAETVLADMAALIDADGRRTAAELARLRRAEAHARRALLHDETERVKEQLSGPDGLEGVRAKRSIREYYRDASWLRLVVVNDDPEPSPTGPAQMKRAA